MNGFFVIIGPPYNFSKMKKIYTTWLILSALTLSACTNIQTTPDRHNDPADPDDSQTPYSQGPTEGPGSMEGPSSPPPDGPTTTASEGTSEELAKLKRTHQVVTATFQTQNGTKEVTLTFNIDEDEVKGILIRPRFTEEPDVTNYRKLTEQVVFKNISDIDIQPISGMEEFSETFTKAYEQAVKMYQQKNS